MENQGGGQVKLQGFFLAVLMIASTLASGAPGLDQPRALGPAPLATGAEPGPGFEENRGQFHPAVLYAAHLPEGRLFVTSGGMTLVQIGPGENGTGPRHAVRLSVEGGHAATAVAEGQVLPTTYNYMLGPEEDWVLGVQRVEAVRLVEILPGVDLRLYTRQGHLEYDFLLDAGIAAESIVVRVEGATARLDGDSLVMETSLGRLSQPAPISFQESHGVRLPVESSYLDLGGGRFGFDVAGVDARLPLTIDPLVYGTYLGASDYDMGRGIATHASFAYVAGLTYDTAFPATPGAYRVDTASGAALLARYSAGEPTVVAVFGGNGSTTGYGVAVTDTGLPILTGGTSSTNMATSPGAYSSTNPGSTSVFAATFTPGLDGLLAATYIGGTSYDRAAGIEIGADGKVYIVGETRSTTFPTTAGAWKTCFCNGYRDGFVLRLDADLTTLEASTLVGSTSNDQATAVAIGDDGFVYITGTGYRGFPTTPGAFQRTQRGYADAFAVKLPANLGYPVYSTLLGGSFYDYGHAVALDHEGHLIVVGSAESRNFPVTSGTFQPTHRGEYTSWKNGDADGFVVRVRDDGSGLIDGTFLGGADYDDLYDVHLDQDGSLVLAGAARSANFPLVEGGVSTTHSGRQDAVVARLDSFLRDLSYSTLVGGNHDDVYVGVAVDENGVVHTTGYTVSPDVPVTPDAHQTAAGGSMDGMYARLNARFLQGVTLIDSHPGCRFVPCGDDTVGITYEIGSDRGWPSFEIPFGDLNRHALVDCGEPCSYWFKFDMRITGGYPLDPGADTGNHTFVQLERWDGTAWTNVSGAAWTVELSVDAGGRPILTLPDRFEAGVDAFGGAHERYRLRGLDVPWGGTWTLEVLGAQAQVVAPPLVLVHGWTRNYDAATYNRPAGWQDDMEYHLRVQAIIDSGQDPWAWAEDTQHGGVTIFVYDKKQDFRTSGVEMLGTVAEILRDTTRPYAGGLDIIAHSMGGLASRHLIEEHLPHANLTAYDLEGREPGGIIGRLVTMGTPHLGSRLGDTYVEVSDVEFPGAPPHADRYYLGLDGRNLGNYGDLFGFTLQWRPWWTDNLNATRILDGLRMQADFELKRYGNPILANMNAERGATGVEYFLLAGYTKGSELYGGNPGDQVVSTYSATLGYDRSFCQRVAHMTGSQGHNDIPDVEVARKWIRAFLFGTADVCQDPDDNGVQTFREHVGNAARRSYTGPIIFPFFFSGDPIDTVLAEFTWNVTDARDASFVVTAPNGSLAGLEFELVQPDGSVARAAAPTANVTWAPVRTTWVDEALVRVHAPVDGIWTLRVLGTGNESLTMLGHNVLNTTLLATDDSDAAGLVGVPLALRLNFTDDGLPVVNATVVAQVALTPDTLVDVPLVDDGTGADAVAGDGVYSGNHTPTDHGSLSYIIEAVDGSRVRTVSGEAAVLQRSDEVGRACILSPATIAAAADRPLALLACQPPGPGDILPALPSLPDPQ